MTLTDKMTAGSLGNLDIAGEFFQSSVKGNLELIVLALVLKQPRCGTDIIKTVHSRFGILLSPGTIYPLLHGLEEKKLLRCESGVKTKTYRPVEGAEKRIREMLDERVKAWWFLSQFLQDISTVTKV